ncbi:MAG: alanine racemase [Candidatus Doudnabacteria bacterium]|nr:alanine racemase [bacterium]MDZ4243513.1 alanine racemase [Candidatus Doudnabacteria bacterium]
MFTPHHKNITSVWARSQASGAGTTWIEISKSALLFNIRQMRRIAGKAGLMAVVKANAYGHGMVEVAGIVRGQVDWFGVAGLDEALLLRKSRIRKPVLVLSYYEKDKTALVFAISRNISFAVYTKLQIHLLDEAARFARRKARIHLKIDTGTSRLGIPPGDLGDFLRLIRGAKHLELEGMFSHFADSEGDDKYTKKQLEIFKRAADRPEFSKALCHIACSAAAIIYPKSRQDLVRIGIALYGLYSSKKIRTPLKPVLSWKTRIIQIKELPKGSYVGYGLSYKTKRNTTLAILPVGYADGYDRKFSNNAEVLVSGRRCRVVGRVCMNLTMIDVTGVPARVGQEAVLLGRQGRAEITADELGKRVGTINYEIVTRINWSLPRYVKA